MELVTKTYSFPSHAGLCEIYAASVVPKEQVRAVLQLSHGMAEYSARYARFIKALAEAGFAVFFSDHVGHGKSVSDKSMLGFFGAENGEQHWVDDLKTVADLAKEAYPDLPFFLFGHGMGSLIARNYTAQYPELFDGVVYSGTSGKNPAVGFGIALSTVLTKLHGPTYTSKLLDRMAFGAYNQKMPKQTPCDWVSRDAEEVRKFMEDDYCGYMYTVSGLKALFKTVKAVSSKAWYAAMPKELPIFLLSGDMDPIGDYGKGVTEVYRTLQSTAHTKVSMKLYPQARHEILNEINRDEVTADILAFLEQCL